MTTIAIRIPSVLSRSRCLAALVTRCLPLSVPGMLQPLIGLPIDWWLKLHVHGTGRFQRAEQLLTHHVRSLAMRRAFDQVDALHGIGLEVIQLIAVPDAVVVHQLVAAFA